MSSGWAWGLVRLRVAQFLANLWHGGYIGWCGKHQLELDTPA